MYDDTNSPMHCGPILKNEKIKTSKFGSTAIPVIANDIRSHNSFKNKGYFEECIDGKYMHKYEQTLNKNCPIKKCVDLN